MMMGASAFYKVKIIYILKFNTGGGVVQNEYAALSIPDSDPKDADLSLNIVGFYNTQDMDIKQLPG